MYEQHDRGWESVETTERIARLRFSPDQMLNDYLGRFYCDESTMHMGQRALFLYSEKFMTYGQGHRADYADDDSSSENPMQTIDRIQAQLHRRMHTQRRLGKHIEFKRLPDRKPGMLIRMGVALDALTAQALQQTVFLERNHSVIVGHAIPATSLADVPQLSEAGRSLQEALDTGRPLLSVESIDVVEKIVQRS